MQRTGILVVGHGSREQASNLEFEQLLAQLRARRPEFEVRHAYIELTEPSLAEGLDAIAVFSGDGTYNEALNGADGQIPFGFLPGGVIGK